MCIHMQVAPTLSLMGGYPGFGMMWLLMPLGMLLCIVVVAAVIWVLIRATRASARSAAPPTPYTPYDRGQRENALLPDASLTEQGRQDEPPASSSYEQPQAHYPEMQQHH